MKYHDYVLCCNEYWNLWYRLGIKRVDRLRLPIKFADARIEFAYGEKK